MNFEQVNIYDVTIADDSANYFKLIQALNKLSFDVNAVSCLYSL